ncbi:MAG: transposase [bacterium]|nr:transposase [bacterium]
MARNTVQFQKGLSLIDFYARFSTEDQCRTELENLRWPDGFRCPKWDSKQFCRLENHKLLQCNECHHQTSVKASKIFQGSKNSLVKLVTSYLYDNTGKIWNFKPVSITQTGCQMEHRQGASQQAGRGYART